MALDRTAYFKAYYLTHREEYAARDKAWSAKNRKKRVQYTLNSRSKNPEKYKKIQEKWRGENRKWFDDYRRANRESIRAALREHYRKNKDQYYEKVLRRRALKAQASVNLSGIKQWLKELKSQKNFICYYCEKSKPISSLHVDHIVSLKEGGEHSLKNLCASCSECNWSKGSKDISGWIRHGQLLFSL